MSASETGVDFSNPLDLEHPLKRLYSAGYACGGVAIGDVNGDDLPDLYFSSGPRPNQLYLQKGGLKFEKAQSEVLAGGSDWGTGAAMVDIDNDGDLDIFQCNYDAPNALFINDGKGAFSEGAVPIGLADRNASLMPAFCDFDRDGDLDLYVLTNSFVRDGGHPKDGVFHPEGLPKMRSKYKKWYDVRFTGVTGENLKHEIYPVGQRDKVFRNDGGKFVDVSNTSGSLAVRAGKGLSATWFDYDGDGWPDLYTGNDFEDSDHLYRNLGRLPDGRVTFKDEIKSSVPHTSWYSMGADVADVDNDGLLDLFSVDMAATSHFKQKASMGDMSSKTWFMVTADPPQLMRNTLLLNTGTGRFREAAFLAGLDSSDWSWAPKLADFDNDGRVDVFISNGMSRPFTHSDTIKNIPNGARYGHTDWDLFENLPPQREKNLAFRNRGKLDFEPTAEAWGLDYEGMTYAAAYGDLDRDGDLDLVTCNLDEPVSIYRNDLKDQGNRVLISLRGAQSNHFGLGAVVRAETAAGLQIRQMNPMTGFLSSNDPVLHFGLGEAPLIDRLAVSWPSGHEQVFESLAVDQHYTITEPGEKLALPAAPVPADRETLFVESDNLAEAVHRDTAFNDFARQPLLPYKLSQFGPGMALGDFDGDGDQDVFMGGGSGAPGALFFNQGDGAFGKAVTEPFEEAAASDDVAALFFDADGDGDSDLYVVSGSNEWPVGDPALRDRLYLNAGGGSIVPAPKGVLPDIADSGSVVAAADFDGDGDQDLFVGSRSLPGKYPLTPDSRLLVNEGGIFSDQTDALAPGLRQSGLVTGAVWSDVDGDKRPDLIVAHDWGPVKIFKNGGGKLSDATADSGAAQLSGWWTHVAAADVDGDGDQDLVALNFGLNTKYHASVEHPALIYYGDFAGSGTANIIEAEFEGEILYPGRGRSCSSGAIPGVGEKFKTYTDFAAASLADVYSSSQLDSAQKFSANTLESGILINDGIGRFGFRPLPRIAQISPGRGAVFTDADGDGKLDLYLVQNFFGPQLETGLMAGGISLLLRGDGSGNFEPVPAAESGLVVPGDASAVVAGDLNGDGADDLLIGVRGAAPQLFLKSGKK